MLIPWGDPLEPGGPKYEGDPSTRPTAAEQAKMIGIGHDGMAFFPMKHGKFGRGGNDHGMLAINHEFGWQWAAELMALGPVAGAVLFALAVRPEKGPINVPEFKPYLLDFWPALRNRPAMGYMLGYAGHCWELFGFRSWLVAFLFFSASLHPSGGIRMSP